MNYAVHRFNHLCWWIMQFIGLKRLRPSPHVHRLVFFFCVTGGWFKQPHLARVGLISLGLAEVAHLWCSLIIVQWLNQPSAHTHSGSPLTCWYCTTGSACSPFFKSAINQLLPWSDWIPYSDWRAGVRINRVLHMKLGSSWITSKLIREPTCNQHRIKEHSCQSRL